jgi:Zn-dependent peptidase ImmA (M78 family)
MVLSEHKARVREIAARFSASDPSREPLDLAARVGVKLEYGDLGDKDGAYDPSRNVIFLNRTSVVERQRFTMAHEITHFLILADEELLSDLHDVYEGETLEEAIEILCNVGASEILIPHTELAEVLSKYGHGARVLPRIVAQFKVSKPAACVALAQQLEGRVIIAILRAAKKADRSSFTVQFSAKTASQRNALAIGTPIPLDHPLMIAFETGLSLVESSYVPFRNGHKKAALVDAHPEGNVVYAILTLPEAD